jgi:hypothetical protein
MSNVWSALLGHFGPKMMCSFLLIRLQHCCTTCNTDIKFYKNKTQNNFEFRKHKTIQLKGFGRGELLIRCGKPRRLSPSRYDSVLCLVVNP